MLDRELAQERLDALAKLGEENMRQILKGLSSAERWEFVEVVKETMAAPSMLVEGGCSELE